MFQHATLQYRAAELRTAELLDAAAKRRLLAQAHPSSGGCPSAGARLGAVLVGIGMRLQGASAAQSATPAVTTAS